jgi:regulator of sigma E protease
MIGVADVVSPAYQAGLRSGDLVSEVAGDAVEDWYGFVERYGALAGDEAVVVVRRGPADGETLEISIPALGDVEALGVIRADVLITAVSEGSPAAAAGLEAGDLILSVDGSPMTSFDSFAEVVRTSEGRALELVVARGGERIAAAVAPEIVQTDLTGMGIEVPRYRIGIVGNNLIAVVGGISTDQVLNPFESIPRSVEMTVEITRLFLRGLGKLFTGEVSRDQLSGPIGIAEIAGKSLERGWMEYLQTLILISNNLGILNLLPIPILDGGQALVFLVEGVRRAPLSLRTREFVQQVGVTMLILIMGFAFWNDISRNWSRVVDWLTGGL